MGDIYSEYHRERDEEMLDEAAIDAERDECNCTIIPHTEPTHQVTNWRTYVPAMQPVKRCPVCCWPVKHCICD